MKKSCIALNFRSLLIVLIANIIFINVTCKISISEGFLNNKIKKVLANNKNFYSYNSKNNNDSFLFNSNTISQKTSNITYNGNDNPNSSSDEIEDLDAKSPSAFENLISRLKQTVVMIDINSDMQFFDESSINSKATGFIVNKELGLIATNKHVTRISPTTHKIHFLNGLVEKGNVVYYDFFHDFGLIQLEAAINQEKYKQSELYKSLNEVELGSSYDLKINDELMLIGNNEGVNYSIKYGIVNNLNLGNFNGLSSIILTNFDRAGGSSGSPVWTKDGKVVAIHAMGNSQGSFEVPIDYLKDVLENYQAKLSRKESKDFFEFNKGFLGVFYNLVPLFKIENSLKKNNKIKKEITESKDMPTEKNSTRTNNRKGGEKNQIKEFFSAVKRHQRDSNEVPELIQINSIIPTLASQNKLKSGDIIVSINDKIVGNDFILLEEILNNNIGKLLTMKVLRFGKIVELNSVKVFSTENGKIFKFLKVANTIFHDINLYVKLFNPLIPEGIIVSKIGLGSPFREISTDGQLLLGSLNSKKINSIKDFIEELSGINSGNSDNVDVMDLTSTSFKFYNFVIDFGNIQELYLYEFDTSKGNWNKEIIKIPQKISVEDNRIAQEKFNKIKSYEEKHNNLNQLNERRFEYNNLFNEY